MTRYTVLWDPEVEAVFVDAWTRSGSGVREILTGAANWIDAQLAVDPEVKGRRSTDLDVHLLAVPLSTTAAQIAVAYQVQPEDRVVRVVRLTFSL